MLTIKTLPEFDRWLNGFKYPHIRLRLARRLDRPRAASLAMSNPSAKACGKCANISERVIACIMYSAALIILLAGGDKSTQTRDIALAQQRARSLEE